MIGDFNSQIEQRILIIYQKRKKTHTGKFPYKAKHLLSNKLETETVKFIEVLDQ